MGRQAQKRRLRLQQQNRDPYLAGKLNHFMRLVVSDEAMPTKKYPNPKDNPILRCSPVESKIIMASPDGFNRLHSNKYRHVLPYKIPYNHYEVILRNQKLRFVPPFKDCFIEFDDLDNYPLINVTAGIRVDTYDLGHTEKAHLQSMNLNGTSRHEKVKYLETRWVLFIYSCAKANIRPIETAEVFPMVKVELDANGGLIDIETREDFNHPNIDEELRLACIALFTFGQLNKGDTHLIPEHE